MTKIIAIDGPASVGKSTLAKKISKKFKAPVLFSGKLYRALALEIIKRKTNLNNTEEILRSMDNGLYATNFGGGQVDITSGKFVFTCTEAYMVEGGKIGAPVKGATLIGNGPDILTRVSMIGNDFALDPGVGTCGKDGQGVPCGVGQPTVKIDNLTVGGTAA